MATSTSKGLVKPDEGEVVDIPVLNNNFDRLNAFAMGPFECTSTTRPSGSNLWEGMIIHETDTNFLWFRSDGGWRFLGSDDVDLVGIRRTLNRASTGKIANAANIKSLVFPAKPTVSIVELTVHGAAGFSTNVGNVKVGVATTPAASVWRGTYGANNQAVQAVAGQWTSVQSLESGLVIPANTAMTIDIKGYTTAADGAYWDIIYKAQRWTYTESFIFDSL